MFFKGVGTISSNEGLLYNYWTIMLTLLKEGLPWDYINEITGEEMTLILAVMSTMKEQQSESLSQLGVR